jgi:hypothetical protein
MRDAKAADGVWRGEPGTKEEERRLREEGALLKQRRVLEEVG